MTETDAMVFVVDDDASIRESLKNLIRSVGLRKNRSRLKIQETLFGVVI
jgi:FixJ family two-component response regulator